MFDWQSSRQREFDKLVKESDQNTANLLEKMLVSNNWEYHILLQLNAFHRELRSKIASDSTNPGAMIKDIYEQSLAGNLPPHHIAVAYKSATQTRLNNLFVDSTLETTNRLSSFALLMPGNPRLEDLKTAADDLSSMCGFPVNGNSIVERQDLIKAKEEGIMLPFTSINNSAWLYWFYPGDIDDRLLVCAVFETAKIPANYAYNAMAKALDSADRGFAVIPFAGNSKAFWSPFLRQHPRLQRFIQKEAPELPLKQIRKEYDQFTSWRRFWLGNHHCSFWLTKA